MIIQYSPVECVLPANVKWANQVKAVMERNKVLCNVQQAKHSEVDKVGEDILRTSPAKQKQSFENLDGVSLATGAILKMAATI